MLARHGHQQSVMTGSSTHNQRIERLWRDIHRSVLVTFGNIFHELEDEGRLDALNEADLYCLHTIYLPRVNKCLSQFVSSWNNHSISTERMHTPVQLFCTGQSDTCSNSSGSDSSCDTDYEDELVTSSHDPVSVPRSSFRPCMQLKQALSVIDPLSHCAQQGKGLYNEAVSKVGHHLLEGCSLCNFD